MNRFVLKKTKKQKETHENLNQKTFYLFLKTQRLCTISNGKASVTPLYEENNEFEKVKLMCQDLVNDRHC